MRLLGADQLGGLNPDGYAAAAERAPLTYFTVEQHYDKLIEVSGGYGERVTEARQVLPALGGNMGSGLAFCLVPGKRQDLTPNRHWEACRQRVTASACSQRKLQFKTVY